jgi:hypothetical protein
VRLTIPCVTGPYTNVSAKLTLTGSYMRAEPQLNSAPIDIPHQRNTSVATSTANNDSGVFELNFRDERYLPFEGAGAVSGWHLELPATVRPFDYDTISDVIVHISYTAKDDGRFKDEVEANLANRFTELAEGEGLIRIFSLKHEFPGALHRLFHPQDGTRPAVEITLEKRHFPFFLHNRALTVDQERIILKPQEGQVLDLDTLDMRLNDMEVPAWATVPNADLPVKIFNINETIGAEGSRWSITLFTIDRRYLALRTLHRL